MKSVRGGDLSKLREIQEFVLQMNAPMALVIIFQIRYCIDSVLQMLKQLL